MKNLSAFKTVDDRLAYWRRVRRLSAQLLAIWFLVTFGTVFFARELSGVTILGWPLSFYLMAQGIVLVYLAIIGFYAWSMRRLDKIIKAGIRNDR